MPKRRRPGIIPGGRPPLPAGWEAYRPRRWPHAADLRITVWAGLLIGLLGVQALRLLPAPTGIGITPPLPVAAPADPYAESRRSREILEAQERPPPPFAGSGETRDSAEERTSTVAAQVRVIDGDTFDYRGMRVRIADIDTPEREGRCPYETRLAARATARMRVLLNDGSFELHPLASGRDEDRYGRKLRIVTRSGRSLGDQLVAEGLARTWTGRREPWC